MKPDPMRAARFASDCIITIIVILFLLSWSLS